MPSVREIRDRFRGGDMAADSAWGLALEVTTMLGMLLAFTLLGRTLGAAGFGGYASLYAIIGPMVTLSASGVTLALLQHVVRDQEPLAETARSCLSLSVLLGMGLTVVGAVAAFWVVDTLSAVAIMAILLIEFLAAPLVNVAASTVQAQTGYAGAARIRTLLVGGRMVIVVALFATGTLTVGSLGVVQLLWSAILAVVTLRWVGRQYGFAFVPGHVRGRHLRSNVVYSAAISADAIGNDGDKVVLAANRFTVDTGLYAAAYRIIGLGLVPVGALVNVSHKRFLEHEDGRRREHLDLALKYSVVAGGYGILFGIATIIAAPLFPLIMGEEFEGSVVMLRWLTPIVFLRAIGIFSLNGLMGLGKVGLRTTIISANAAFGVVLFLVLIPKWGWQGAAAASLITESLQVVMTWSALVICQRRADRALDAGSS